MASVTTEYYATLRVKLVNSSNGDFPNAFFGGAGYFTTSIRGIFPIPVEYFYKTTTDNVVVKLRAGLYCNSATAATDTSIACSSDANGVTMFGYQWLGE